jgi:DNA-3-methyladenine glycosylase II
MKAKPDFADSLRALRKDAKLAPHVRKHGPLDIVDSHRNKKNIFHSLLRAIVYQQISGKAAASILARVEALFPKSKPTPVLMLAMSVHKLRAAGLSPQKIGYARDLALKCSDGTIDEKLFPKMSSQEVVDHLVEVKGIGEWTAQMLLIFTLYRKDILPTGDLGVQKGMQIVYGMKKLPTKEQMEKRAQPWRLHATAAAWYFWRVADDAKTKPGNPKTSRRLKR